MRSQAAGRVYGKLRALVSVLAVNSRRAVRGNNHGPRWYEERADSFPRTGAERGSSHRRRKGCIEICRGSLTVVEEALEVLFDDYRLARGDVAQLAVFHPLLQPVDQAEQVIEGIHDEQQRLVVVDLESLVDSPLELDRIALYVGRYDGVLN